VKAEGSDLELQLAAAKVARYADRESGDTLEVVERPHGGISVVLADGQHTGRGAKAISNVVARKAIALLADGVRDGAAARAANDYLYSYRKGKASATLNIVSADLVTRSLVVSRNSHCPVVIACHNEISLVDEPSSPVGLSASTRPNITELDLTEGLVVVAFTDGVLNAGERQGKVIDVPKLVEHHLKGDGIDAAGLAERVLGEALTRDEGRPNDDMSVLVLSVAPSSTEGTPVRRLTMHFPLRGIEGRGM
jgi:serine phosphatase RsbU (regulator of sigma subunit)